MNFKILLFFLLASLILKSQIEPYNKFNSNGQKHGYWICYLDQNIEPIDSINSNFFGYNYYDNGKLLYGFFKQTGKEKSRDFILKDFKFPEKGKPEPINGTFKHYANCDSSLKYVVIFEKGFLVSEKEYSKWYEIGWNSKSSTYHMSSFADLTKKYNQIQGTYYYERYFPNKPPQKYWFRKGKRWKLYRIKD